MLLFPRHRAKSLSRGVGGCLVKNLIQVLLFLWVRSLRSRFTRYIKTFPFTSAGIDLLRQLKFYLGNSVAVCEIPASTSLQWRRMEFSLWFSHY